MHCLWSTQGDIVCSEPSEKPLAGSRDTVEPFYADQKIQVLVLNVGGQSTSTETRVNYFTISKAEFDAQNLSGMKDRSLKLTHAGMNPAYADTTKILSFNSPSPCNSSLAQINLEIPVKLKSNTTYTLEFL